MALCPPTANWPRSAIAADALGVTDRWRVEKASDAIFGRITKGFCAPVASAGPWPLIGE